MHVLKTIAIGIVVSIALVFLIFKLRVLFLFQDFPYNIEFYFNRINIEEAIQLAQNCQIKVIGEPHIHIGVKALTLSNASHQFLVNKYEVVDHRRVYDDNYEKFYQLINDSESRCGFRIQNWIE